MTVNPDNSMKARVHEVAEPTDWTVIASLETESLHDGSSGLRNEAAIGLGTIGAVAAVPALIRALADPNDYTREHVVTALVQIGIGGFPELVHAFEDRDYHVRESAAAVLQELSDVAAVPALICFLGDAADRVRFQAAKALGEIGDAAAVPGLVHALADSDYGVRSAAVRALGEIGDTGALPALFPVLADPHYFVRVATVQALGELGDSRVVPAVSVALSDENYYVRRAAVQALGNIRGAEVVPALFRALTDAGIDVRQIAAEILVEVGGAAVVPMLIQALVDPYADVGHLPAVDQGEMGVCDLSTLVRALRDANASVRCTAAEALGHIGDVRAVPALIQAMKDDDSTLACVAVQALKTVGGVDTLPCKVLAAAHLAPADRVSMLTALGRVRLTAEPTLRYRVLPIVRYCRNLLKRTDVAQGVASGAREVLAQQMLLRPGVWKSATEAGALLRAISAADCVSSPAELVRGSDAHRDSETRQAVRNSRVRAVWNRFFT